MKMPSTEHSKEWFKHYMSASNIVLFKLEGKISDVAQYLLSVSIILYVYNYIIMFWEIHITRSIAVHT